MNETAFYIQFLRNEFAERKERNSRYSIRAFAKAMDMSAGAINQILSGKRVPSYRSMLRILHSLRISPESEGDVMASLASVQKKRDLKRTSPAFKAWDGPARPRDLSLELFRCISDWHHYGILELTYVKDFNPDPEWISDQMGISVPEARFAIDRLLDLGLLELKDGSLTKSHSSLTTADKHLTTPALRKRQKQVLGKAIEALDRVPIELRNQSAMTMAIDPDLLPVAKRMIEEFSLQLCGFLESKSRKKVYELSVSLFPLQKIEKESL